VVDTSAVDVEAVLVELEREVCVSAATPMDSPALKSMDVPVDVDVIRTTELVATDLWFGSNWVAILFMERFVSEDLAALLALVRSVEVFVDFVIALEDVA
jgi:hypothetical protein